MQLRGSLLVLPAFPQLKNHTGVPLQRQSLAATACPNPLPGPGADEQPCPRATNPAPPSPALAGSSPTGEKRSAAGLAFSLPSEPFCLRGSPGMILGGVRWPPSGRSAGRVAARTAPAPPAGMPRLRQAQGRGRGGCGKTRTHFLPAMKT
ncbi:uncharacterized protein LOC115909890 [Camarhynchus parvulus]|uniref:uncharacterized protein LOC115909890 n=1 Tax=Geospiza parvula TaxID=87175 RepID=UPI00123829FA|nr:uncharacterized protein LOC115909890 [Camarhynchus parvulus]